MAELITTPNPEKDAILARVLIHTMNFELLAAQKRILLEMQSKETTNGTESNTIEGILSLIDCIQDMAVDHYGRKNKSVFTRVNVIQAMKIVNTEK